MIKTLLTISLLLAIGDMANAQARDTPPTTPGNPVARAYGPTSGGISWQRSSDDRGVHGYEIVRDGTVLGVHDVLSYVAKDLQPGRGYNFAIVAIDTAGQRSARALARIETPDARPNTPIGLTANVYSATFAGIKWDRSGVFGERYEVKRDGQVVVAATTATSYVDRSLSNRRPYLFEVIAINRQGQRSTAARHFVSTTDGSTAPPMAGPAAPSGLRSVVYSATAGAIAWDRAATGGLRYDISRDGTLLASTDGTSFVDSNLAGGQTYTYDVVAIDRAGRLSSASQVTLTTTTASTPPIEPPSDNPFAEGEPNPAIPSSPDDETSMPGPADDEPPRSSEPGGDTSAVAGFWDGSILVADERYFVIEPNGLWIEYFRMYDGDVARNCFAFAETQTLTPEDPAANAYSLADGRLLTLVTDADGDTLEVEFDFENRSESWPAVVGRLPEDLPLCSDQ